MTAPGVGLPSLRVVEVIEWCFGPGTRSCDPWWHPGANLNSTPNQYQIA